MNEIAVRPVPKDQRYITSILQNFPEILKVRTTALACAEGYPVGSALVGYIRAYLAVPTVKQLKANLLALRDILRYSASVIETMPSLRVDKYQLSFADVTNYMSLHKTAYGFSHLTSADITLASYLITSSEEDAENWLAEFDASPSNNLASVVDALYRDAGSLGLHAKSYSDIVVSLVLRERVSSDDIRTIFDHFQQRFSDADIYSPSADAIIPVKQYDHYSFLKTELVMSRLKNLGKKQNEGKSNATNNSRTEFIDSSNAEATALMDDFGNSVLTTSILAISDIRLIDHIATLLFDDSAWRVFITNRPKPDPASNLERARGLSRLSGLLHSLLMYPHVLRSRMLMSSYDSMSGFIGIVPSLPADLTQNFEKYVVPFDVLGCGRDAAQLLDSLVYSNKRGGGDSDGLLKGFPIELLSSVSVLSRLGSLPSAVPPISALAMTSLTSITRNVTYDEIIAAVPIQRVAYVSDITSFLATSNVFQSNIRTTIAVISSGYSDAYQKEIDAFLSTASFSPWVDLATSPTTTFSIDNSSSPSVTKGVISGVDNVPFATAYLQRLRQTAEVGFFYTVRNYVAPRRRPFPSFPLYAVISDHVDRWNELVPTAWKAMYPATVFSGSEVIDVDTIVSQSFELDLLLEKLSGSHIAIFKRYLENSSTIRNWATVLSSSCLLFDCANEEQVLIEGWGNPYGTTYATLRTLNLGQNLLRIGQTRFAVMFLRRIPVPTDQIVPIVNVPYPRYGMMVVGEGGIDISAPVPSSDVYSPNEPLSYETLFSSRVAHDHALETADEPRVGSRLLYVISKPYQHMALINIETQTSSIPSFTFDARHAYRLDGLALHLDPLESLPAISTRKTASLTLNQRSDVGNMLKLAPGLRVTSLGAYLGSSAPGTPLSATQEVAAIAAVVKDMETQMEKQQGSDEAAASANVISLEEGSKVEDQVAKAINHKGSKNSKS